MRYRLTIYRRIYNDCGAGFDPARRDRCLFRAAAEYDFSLALDV